MPVLQSCVIAGRSLAVLELAEALLCWGCRILLVVPRVQLSTPGVAREDVCSELVGESFLSTNRLTLLLHPLPHRASGASVGAFQSSSSCSRNHRQSLVEGRENPQTGISSACHLRRPTVNRHDHRTLAEKSLRTGERDTNIMEPNLRLLYAMDSRR